MKKLLIALVSLMGFAFADQNNMSNMDMSNMKGMSSGAHAKMKSQSHKNVASSTK